MRIAPSILEAQYRKCGLTMPVPPKVKRPTRYGVYRSKLERSYADHLAFRMRAGEIEAYWYEPVSFALGGRRSYKPDWLIEYADGRREWHETKGFCWQKDSIRMDFFLTLYPGETLVIVTREKGAWIHTTRGRER